MSFVIFVVVGLFNGCAYRKALRPTLGLTGDPPTSISKADAWYIESGSLPHRKPISCSFIEFDELDDFVDIQQYNHACGKVRQLAKEDGRLMLVFYLHGWKHNSQSSGVLGFNRFLEKIASSPFAKDGGFRVHGVYLAWRGGVFRHPRVDDDDADTPQAYGEPIINPDYARSRLVGLVSWLPEQLSYWNRKKAAEDKVMGIALARTIFTLSHTARRYSLRADSSRVFLIGHSFGALMLERSIAPTSLAQLAAAWPAGDDDLMSQSTAQVLPFDLILFVNSAAPSIYAKQFYEYLAAHQEALASHDVGGGDLPLVISITSTADVATRVAHRWGNALAGFNPRLWRDYDARSILVMDTNAPSLKISKSYYYKRTPGHNPLLVNQWVIPFEESSTTITNQTLDLSRPAQIAPRNFHTSPPSPGGPTGRWTITTTPPDKKWSSYKGFTPACITTNSSAYGYWIMRCPKGVIPNHGAVWSDNAAEVYASLLREVELRRAQKRLSRKP